MEIKTGSFRSSFPLFEDSFFSSNKQVYIHPTSYVGKNVILHENVKIGPFCTIIGNVTIGTGTRIFSNVTIGYPAQDRSIERPLGTIEIGAHCFIREYVSINSSKNLQGKTILGDQCYIMNFSHIGHDSILENKVTLINNVNIGGHVHIEHSCMLMANSSVHQFCRIGKFTSIAPYSATRQDLPPFSLFSGLPLEFAGLNKVALKRAHFTGEDINALKYITRLYFQEKLLLEDIQTRISSHPLWGHNTHVQEFLEFIKKSKRGVSRRALHTSL